MSCWASTLIVYVDYKHECIFMVGKDKIFMPSALGSVVNAKPESARWLLTGSRYVASSPANSLALNELVQCSLPMWQGNSKPPWTDNNKCWHKTTINSWPLPKWSWSLGVQLSCVTGEGEPAKRVSLHARMADSAADQAGAPGHLWYINILRGLAWYIHLNL